MYEEHFGLKSRPFGAKAEGAGVFVGPQQATIMNSLTKGLGAADAIVTVSGPVGVGKTTIVSRALESISPGRMVAWVGRMQLASDEVLELLLTGFGVSLQAKGTIQRFAAFRRLLGERAAAGAQVAIVVEDAHRIGIDALIELEALTAADTGDSTSANIILMGQPHLNKLLAKPELARMRQRNRLRQEIKAFSETEVGGYLKHCIREAGGDYDAIFDSGVASILYKCSEGVPRIINTLCETAMTTAMEEGLARVTANLMRQVAMDAFGYEATQTNAIPVMDSAAFVTPEATAEIPEVMVGSAADPDNVEVLVDDIPDLVQDTHTELKQIEAENEAIVNLEVEATQTQKILSTMPSNDELDNVNEIDAEFSLDAALSVEAEETNVMPGITPNLDQLAANARQTDSEAQAIATDPTENIPTLSDSMRIDVEVEVERANKSEAQKAPAAALRTQAKAKAEPQPVVATRPETEPVVATKPEPEAVIAPKPQSNPVIAPKPQSKPVVAPKPQSKPVVAPKPQSEAVVAPKPAPVVAPKPAPVVAPKPAPVVTPKPAPVVAPKPEPEAVIAPKPQSKPVVAPKPQSKPVVAPKPQSKPVVAPKPEPVAAAAVETEQVADAWTSFEDDPSDESESVEQIDSTNGPLTLETDCPNVTEGSDAVPAPGAVKGPEISSAGRNENRIPDIDALEAALDAAKKGDFAIQPDTAPVADLDRSGPGLRAKQNDEPAPGIPEITLDDSLPQKNENQEELRRVAEQIGAANSLEDVNDVMAETIFGSKALDEIAAAVVANPPEEATSPVMLEGAESPAAANVASPAGNPAKLDKSAAKRLDMVKALKAGNGKAATPKVEEIELSSGKPGEAPAPPRPTGPQPEPIENQINTSMTQTLKALSSAQVKKTAQTEDDDKKSGGLFSRFRRSS